MYTLIAVFAHFNRFIDLKLTFHTNPYLNLASSRLFWFWAPCGWIRVSTLSLHIWVYNIMYRSNRSFNILPLGIPRAFDTFAVPGRREFDYQRLLGGGVLDPHALGVGNLNCTLNFMLNLWRGELTWGTQCYLNFVEKIVPLWPIGYKVCAVFEGI